MNDMFKIRKAEPDEYPEIEKIFEAQGLENNKNGVEIFKAEVSPKSMSNDHATMRSSISMKYFFKDLG